MANTRAFKNAIRSQRQSTIETEYNSGMMYNNGTVDFGYVKMLVNYDLYNDGKVLIPRPGLRTDELIVPDITNENDESYADYHRSENLQIQDAKECTEFDGKVYRQFILGEVDEDDNSVGTLFVTTSEKTDVTEKYLDDLEEYSVKTSLAKANVEGHTCAYYTTDLKSIHSMELESNSQVASLIGTFAFGNSFYFIDPEQKCLCKTYFSDDNDANIYLIEEITAEEIDASEATTYGYNMLLGDNAYVFSNVSLSGDIQLTGILPYSTKNENELLMTPKKNEDVYLRCYFKADPGRQYKFIWEWRTIDESDWNTIQSLESSPTYTVTAYTSDEKSGQVYLLGDDNVAYDKLEVLFKAPADEIMVRVQAINIEDITSSDEYNVEQAMTMGFNFTVDTYGEATNVDAETYDLTTATGMTVWKSRLVLWGVTKDPTILFMSDVNEPAYFPYPNNVGIYDEPIVCVKPFLDSLLVFTTSMIHQITMDEDGTSWTSSIIQGNLHIDPWDRHLIQIVRNMVFFKSGNYYFMIVPKYQSSTGELCLAPVSTPMVEFFNNFEPNVEDMLKDTFDYTDGFTLVNYYNFLDYEDIHNVYVFTFSLENRYLHLDIIYNTVDRYWRIHTFEAPHFLYSYRHDATQKGQLASTSLMKAQGGTVSIKEPDTVIETVDKLILGTKGFDLDNVENIRLQVYTSVGVQYIDTVLKSWAWYSDHYITVSDGTYTISTELEDSEINFILTGGSFYCSSKVVLTSSDSGDEITTIDEASPYANTMWQYTFDFALDNSCYLMYNGVKYPMNRISDDGTIYYSDLFYVEVIDSENFIYNVVFNESNSGSILRLISVSDDDEDVDCRLIQIYRFDNLDVSDFYVPPGVTLVYEDTDDLFSISSISVKDSFQLILNNYDDYFFFKNWQFIDTGYRDIDMQAFKRFRELQLQINNVEGLDLYFGMEFTLDGDKRLGYYSYEIDHIVDEDSLDYGLIYIEATPKMNAHVPNETTFGSWVLNQSKFPEVNLWKIRSPISGKGSSPRLRLVSRNECRYELININWIYRSMNMR